MDTQVLAKPRPLNKQRHEPASIEAFIESLYANSSLDDAFQVLENQTRQAHYGEVLYSYVPKVLVESGYPYSPIYKTSAHYNQNFLNLYQEKELEKVDPILDAINNGEKQPIHWWGSNNKLSNDEHGVLTLARECGIRDGFTIPLQSNSAGMAWISFINAAGCFSPLEKNQAGFNQIRLKVMIFHSHVMSRIDYKREFHKSFLDSLSSMETRFLARLSKGQSPSEIAYDLNTSERYLEQVMLKMRRRFSGVSSLEPPSINRNRMLYHAGLLDILGCVETRI